MKALLKSILLAAALLASLSAHAQKDGYDVFIPITKYMAQGNAEALSAWFAQNLEIGIITQENTASRSQARQMMKVFFDTYTPRSFNVTHTAGRANMKYVIGELNAGGETFNVTIFAKCKKGDYRIQELRIYRM